MALNPKEQEIVKRYGDLPEDVQKALFSAQTSDSIFEIGKKNGILVDKIGELADETGLVMLGMTKPSEFIRNLTQRLAIAPEKAKAIAEDINQKVFAAIRESLKKIHGITPAPVAPLLDKEGVGGGISEKVQKILKEHEIAKQEKKETKYIFPDENNKIPPTSPILSGKIEAAPAPQIPDVFVKKLPSNDPYKEPIE